MDRATFLASLEAFHAERQVELSPGPLLGKTVDLYEMFVTALRHGGFPRINKNNKWAFLAKQLGLIPRDRPASAQDLDQVKRFYVRWIRQYEGERLPSHVKQMLIPGGLEATTKKTPAATGGAHMTPNPQTPSQQQQQPFLQGAGETPLGFLGRDGSEVAAVLAGRTRGDRRGLQQGPSQSWIPEPRLHSRRGRLFTRYSAEAVAARQAKRRRREALVRQGQIAPAVDVRRLLQSLVDRRHAPGDFVFALNCLYFLSRPSRGISLEQHPSLLVEVGGLLEEASSACREKGLVLPVLGDSCCCKGPTGFAPPLDLPLLLGSVFDPTVSPEERAASVAEPTLPSDLLLKSARRFSPDGGGASCGALGGEGDLAAQTMQISSALIANLLLSVENRQFLAGFSKQQTQLALLRASAAAAESLCGPVTEDALANCSDALAAQTEERSAVADEQTDLESDLVETAAAVLSEEGALTRHGRVFRRLDSSCVSTEVGGGGSGTSRTAAGEREGGGESGVSAKALWYGPFADPRLVNSAEGLGVKTAAAALLSALDAASVFLSRAERQRRAAAAAAVGAAEEIYFQELLDARGDPERLTTDALLNLEGAALLRALEEEARRSLEAARKRTSSKALPEKAFPALSSLGGYSAARRLARLRRLRVLAGDLAEEAFEFGEANAEPEASAAEQQSAPPCSDAGRERGWLSDKRDLLREPPQTVAVLLPDAAEFVSVEVKPDAPSTVCKQSGAVSESAQSALAAEMSLSQLLSLVQAAVGVEKSRAEQLWLFERAKDALEASGALEAPTLRNFYLAVQLLRFAVRGEGLADKLRPLASVLKQTLFCQDYNDLPGRAAARRALSLCSLRNLVSRQASALSEVAAPFLLTATSCLKAFGALACLVSKRPRSGEEALKPEAKGEGRKARPLRFFVSIDCWVAQLPPSSSAGGGAKEKTEKSGDSKANEGPRKEKEKEGETEGEESEEVCERSWFGVALTASTARLLRSLQTEANCRVPRVLRTAKERPRHRQAKAGSAEGGGSEWKCADAGLHFLQAVCEAVAQLLLFRQRVVTPHLEVFLSVAAAVLELEVEVPRLVAPKALTRAALSLIFLTCKGPPQLLLRVLRDVAEAHDEDGPEGEGERELRTASGAVNSVRSGEASVRDAEMEGLRLSAEEKLAANPSLAAEFAAEGRLYGESPVRTPWVSAPSKAAAHFSHGAALFPSKEKVFSHRAETAKGPSGKLLGEEALAPASSSSGVVSQTRVSQKEGSSAEATSGVGVCDFLQQSTTGFGGATSALPSHTPKMLRVFVDPEDGAASSATPSGLVCHPHGGRSGVSLPQGLAFNVSQAPRQPPARGANSLFASAPGLPPQGPRMPLQGTLQQRSPFEQQPPSQRGGAPGFRSATGAVVAPLTVAAGASGSSSGSPGFPATTEPSGDTTFASENSPIAADSEEPRVSQGFANEAAHGASPDAGEEESEASFFSSAPPLWRNNPRMPQTTRAFQPPASLWKDPSQSHSLHAQPRPDAESSRPPAPPTRSSISSPRVQASAARPESGGGWEDLDVKKVRDTLREIGAGAGGGASVGMELPWLSAEEVALGGGCETASLFSSWLAWALEETNGGTAAADGEEERGSGAESEEEEAPAEAFVAGGVGRQADEHLSVAVSCVAVLAADPLLQPLLRPHLAMLTELAWLQSPVSETLWAVVSELLAASATTAAAEEEAKTLPRKASEKRRSSEAAAVWGEGEEDLDRGLRGASEGGGLSEAERVVYARTLKAMSAALGDWQEVLRVRRV